VLRRLQRCSCPRRDAGSPRRRRCRDRGVATWVQCRPEMLRRHLLGSPLSCRMIRNVAVHDAATDMRQHYHHEEDATGERRDGEEIHGRSRREMIREKRNPRLRRRPCMRCMRFQRTRDVRSETSSPSVRSSTRGAPPMGSRSPFLERGQDLSSAPPTRPQAVELHAMNDSAGLLRSP